MNVEFDTNDGQQVDSTSSRKTIVRSKNSQRAANSASLEEGADTTQVESVLDDSTQSHKSDPRKVHELNADDFFKLGRFRI